MCTRVFVTIRYSNIRFDLSDQYSYVSFEFEFADKSDTKILVAFEKINLSAI